MFNFEVNENEANLIIQALNELPRKVSNDLFDKIQKQAAIQIKEIAEKKEGGNDEN